MELNNLLQTTVDKKASDLHIIPGFYPSLRINSELLWLRDLGVLSGEMVQNLILPLLSNEQKKVLQENYTKKGA